MSSLSTVNVPNRVFYRVSGIDSKKYLQGICTNDVNKLDKHGACIAAAFLTPGGRIVADALLYNVDENIVIETHSLLGNSLDRYLRVYKLRSKVTIEKLDLQCQLGLDDLSRADIAEVAKSYGAIVGAVDPRTNDMGTRFLVPKIKVTDNSRNDGAWYDRFRLLRGISEGPPIVDRIPLECNLDLLNYVSFSKGCYVGQELTARTKYKGLVRKRLVPFIAASTAISNTPFNPIDEQYLKEPYKVISAQSSAKVIIDDRIFLSTNGIIQGNMDKASSIGEVVDFSSENGVGLAMMRLSNILGKKEDAVPNQFVTSSNQVIATFRPSWFPDIDPITGKAMDDHLNE